MQLQYVFGNPVKKREKGLGTRKKSRKLKRGGTVKKKRKFSAKQIAAQKKFAAMARARAKAARSNPKRRKKRNPTVTAELPVYKKVTKKYPGEGKVAKKMVRARDTDFLAKELLKSIEGMSHAELLEGASSNRRALKEAKKRLAAAKTALIRTERARERGEAWKNEVLKKGGRILSEKPDKEDVMANPKKRRRKRKGKKAHATSKLKVTMNPKKKRKKAKKAKKAKKSYRRKRKASGVLLQAAGAGRITKRARASFKRKKKLNIRVKVNPDFKGMALQYGVAALGGAAYPWFNYGVNKIISMVDQYVTKGALGTNLAKIDNLAPGLAAPTVSLVACVAVKELDKRMRLLDKLPYRAEIHQALDVVAILSAAGIGMALAEKAKVTPAGMGLSGVRYFPGAMSGADFGYLGEYKQSKADFGGVKFFPKSQMAGVEFFADGARGDEMYTSAEKDDLAEAHGLGLIPEGMGSADFGEIPEGLGVVPEGLGGDEGQMG